MLYKELSVDYPTMSVATVYSTAQLLADAGLIKILSIDDKRVYFDPTTSTHGHFLCKNCSMLVDLGIDEEVFQVGKHSSEQHRPDRQRRNFSLRPLHRLLQQ